jgi:O-methyltransferase involved in polyketide biosynthesis
MTWKPPDFSKPSVARVHDALLGGHGNFAADRELAGRLLEICPDLGSAARENKTFIARAASWAARQGVRQYADLGCGLPAYPSAAAAARAVVPSVRLVYVDHDPVVTAHVRALLVTGDGDASVAADLTDPASVLADPAWLGLIDMAEPVCFIFGPVLNLMPARQAREVVAAYADRAAPGSYVVISCGRCDDEAVWQQIRGAYTAAGLHNHTPAEVAGFLAGLELVPSGLTAAQSWRGGWHDVPVTPPGPAYVLAGVAKKL